MELIKIQNETALLDERVSLQIATFERQMKLLKEQEDKLKKEILKEMQDKNLVKIETDDFILSYIAPTDRERFDTKRFRSQHEDLYDEFISMTPVKASIRIKLKG